jgi:hypothetical protein
MIDGVAWSADVASGQGGGGAPANLLVVGGVDSKVTYLLELEVALPSNQKVTVGSYSLDATLSSAGGSVERYSPIGAWTSSSGNLTITTLTDHHLVGTFAFDATPDSESPSKTPAVLHVTNGKFDVTF